LEQKIAALRNLLWQMEVEVGLEKLPQPQKDVYYAACLAADENEVVHSEAVKQQPLLAPMSRPTFYRALKELVEKGILVQESHSRDGRYLVKR
jgi:hypothetical protein